MTNDEKLATEYALRERADCFRQFSRNGRWGTCCDCPRDRDGHAYPEFCPRADRHDHWLTAHSLADSFETYKRTGR
jgi:hypothetical protein